MRTGDISDRFLLLQIHCAGLRGNYVQSWRRIFFGGRWESRYPTLSFSGANDKGGATLKGWASSLYLAPLTLVSMTWGFARARSLISIRILHPRAMVLKNGK